MIKSEFRKKVLALSYISAIALSFLSPMASQNVYAKDTMITSPGFFTKQFVADAHDCEEVEKEANEVKKGAASDSEKAEKAYENETGKEGTFEESENSKAREVKVLTTTGSAIVDGITDEKGEKGVLGINCGEFSITPMMDRLIQPVNITQSSMIMSLVYKFQLFALGIGVLLISVFGMYYALGNQTIDPIKFLLRGFFVLFFVYFIPYIAQDLLNINNMLVYWIASEDIKILTSESLTVGIGAAIASGTSIGITAMVNALFLGSVIPGVLFFALIIIIVAAAFVIGNIVKLTFWWYARLLMIIFLVALGPLFMVMMILPQTANYGKNWINYFVGEVFTQFSLVLGLWMMSYILVNFSTLKAETGMGWIGQVFIVIGVYKLLNLIPNMSKKLIGSDIGGIGWNDAVSAGKSMSSFVEKAGMAGIHAMQHKMRDNKIEKEGTRKAELEEELNGLESGTRAYKNTKNELNNLQGNMAKDASRYESAQKTANILNGKGSFGSVNDLETLQKRAHDKALFNDENRKENMINNELGKLSKQKADATELGVLNDLDKDANKAEDKFLAKKAKLDEQIKSGFIDDASYDAQMAVAKRERGKELGIIEANKKNDGWVASEVDKRQREYNDDLLKLGGKIAGDGFENGVQKNAAISALAGEIDKLASPKANDHINKDIKDEKEGYANAVSTLKQSASALNSAQSQGVNEIASRLVATGKAQDMSEGVAMAKDLIDSHQNLDALRNGNKKLLQNASNEKKMENLTSMEKEQLATVQGEINGLTGKMSAITGGDETIHAMVGPASNNIQKAQENLNDAKNQLARNLPKSEMVVGADGNVTKAYPTIEQRENRATAMLSNAMATASIQNLGGISNVMNEVANGNGAALIQELEQSNVPTEQAELLVDTLSASGGKEFNQAVSKLSSSPKGVTRTGVNNAVAGMISTPQSVSSLQGYDKNTASAFINDTVSNGVFQEAIQGKTEAEKINGAIGSSGVSTFAAQLPSDIEHAFYERGVSNPMEAAMTFKDIAPVLNETASSITSDSGYMRQSEFIGNIQGNVGSSYDSSVVQDLAGATYVNSTSAIPDNVKIGHAFKDNGIETLVSDVVSGNESSVANTLADYNISPQTIQSVIDTAQSVSNVSAATFGAGVESVPGRTAGNESSVTNALGDYNASPQTIQSAIDTAPLGSNVSAATFGAGVESMPSRTDFVEMVMSDAVSASGEGKDIDVSTVEAVATASWNQQSSSIPTEVKVELATSKLGGAQEMVTSVVNGFESDTIGMLEEYGIDNADEVVNLIVETKDAINYQSTNLQNNPITEDSFVRGVISRSHNKESGGTQGFRQVLKMYYDEVLQETKNQHSNDTTDKNKQ